MTEAEWLACTDPEPIVKYLRRRKASVRKWRLVAIACCRSGWHLLLDERSRKAVLVAERFADGKADKAELRAAHKAAYDLYETDERDFFDPGRHALGVAARVAMTTPGNAFNRATEGMDPSDLCALLREVFGDPFRPIALDSSWLTPTVKALATTIYEERAFERMPIVADALEEAGCTSKEALRHCRNDGEHVKGCWVLDKVLGKE